MCCGKENCFKGQWSYQLSRLRSPRWLCYKWSGCILRDSGCAVLHVPRDAGFLWQELYVHSLQWIHTNGQVLWKKKHRLRKKWNFHTLAAIWNFSTFYQESFSSNYVVKERKHTAADIQKDRSYLEKSALQAMTFLIAKTISNKVWGLCLPRKLARVSFSRKKKLKAALIGSLMSAILLRVWRNLSRQFASRFLLSTKILVLATSSSFYLFEKSSARGLQSIQKSYWGS